MKLVHVHTAEFQGDAVWLYDMPLTRVTALQERDPFVRARLAADLFGDAIQDAQRREQFYQLPYMDAMEAINAWFRADPVEVVLPRDTRGIEK